MLGDSQVGCSFANAEIRPIARNAAGVNGHVSETLAPAFERAKRNGRPVSLVMVRIENFREIEDACGARVGLQLQRECARRLRSVTRAEDFVLQTNSDEYAVLVPNVGGRSEAFGVCERLVRSCSGVWEVRQLRMRLEAHAGVARYPYDATSPARLVRLARMALHCAAAASDINPSKIRDVVFSWDAVKRVHGQVRLAAELDTALDENRFVLHFQPIFDIKSQQSVGAEALLRLRDADGRLLSPDKFLPLAERTGQIVGIGRWVMREACTQLAKWRAEGRTGLRMAVNISPRQLLDPDFVALVSQSVEQAGIEHNHLILEVTESEALENTAITRKVFAQLAARGVEIAVDDFGKGYSGLSNLLHLPLAIMKIDRSLLREIGASEKAARIIGAIVAMGRELDLTIVAEGIETEDQYRILAGYGCQLGQGFGYARPQSEESFLMKIDEGFPWKFDNQAWTKVNQGRL